MARQVYPCATLSRSGRTRVRKKEVRVCNISYGYLAFVGYEGSHGVFWSFFFRAVSTRTARANLAAEVGPRHTVQTAELLAFAYR